MRHEGRYGASDRLQWITSDEGRSTPRIPGPNDSELLYREIAPRRRWLPNRDATAARRDSHYPEIHHMLIPDYK